MGNLVYPLTNVIVLPVATLIFKYYGVSFMFALEGVLLIVAATFERLIDIDEETKDKIVFNVKSHFEDIKEGFIYLFQEKGIWYVYLFFVIMMFADGFNILIYPYFEKHQTLTLIHYSFLLSLQSAGYMVGGFLHYFVKIPTHLRYAISVVVYLSFAFFDGIFFLMPFVIMVMIKFSLGILGMNSANIRVTSINAYIDDTKRGRLNAVYQTMIGVAMMLGKLWAGWLGERYEFINIGIIFGGIILIGVMIFIIGKREAIKPLYNREV